MSLLGSTGKSGSFFFYSQDNKYLIKAIPQREYKSFKRILENYYFHLKAHKNSLITRIYGLHKIHFYKHSKFKKTLYICVMENILANFDKNTVLYDLKGSTYKRSIEEEEKSSAPFKDNDFLKNNDKIVINKNKKMEILDIIKFDVDFLKKNGLIDYSLLIAIPKKYNPSMQSNLSNISKIFDPDERNDKEYTRILDDCGYRIGIIDFLTRFTCSKRVEYLSKRFVCGRGVSCIPPNYYGNRFYDFVSRNVFIVNNMQNFNKKKFIFARSSILNNS